MTHEDYLALIDQLTDADAPEVLEHAAACPRCRRDARASDSLLSRLEPRSGSILEEVSRWAAVAAVLAVIVFGLRHSSSPPKPAAALARYRVVGDASGVVAYTPGGMVVGLGTKPVPKEVVR